MVVQIRDDRDRLNLLQTFDLVPLQTRGPELYRQTMLFESASIQSTLYVKSADAGATLTVRYRQFTTGRQFDEIQDLQAHPLVTDADVVAAGAGGFHHVLTVTRIHNKPYIECEVTGGNVEFGVYVTLKSDFSSDVDSALHLDGDAWAPTSDKGLPIMCLDDTTGILNFLRCKDGQISVNDDIGDPLHLVAQETITPATEQELIRYTVPADTQLNLRKVRVVSRANAKFEVRIDGQVIGSGLCGPAQAQSEIFYDPRERAFSGEVLTVDYKATGAPLNTEVEAYVMGSTQEE